MAGQFSKDFTFVTGAVRHKDVIYLSLVIPELAEEKVDHALVLVASRGRWGGKEIGKRNYSMVGVTVCTHPTEQAIYLGHWGEVLCVGGGGFHEEKIPTDRPGQNTGPMSALRAIDGRAYAVGMGRRVFRRDGKDQWTSISQGARVGEKEKITTGFETIDGFSKTEVYAAGWNGELWQYNDKVWKQLHSPTNLILTNMACAGDGNVYVCGRLGTLLKGRESRWEVVEHEATEADFWGIAWFKDRLYLSTSDALYRLDGDKLELITDFGDETPRTFHHLSARDGVLCSIGPKDLLVYDGEEWTRLD